jgi:predicted transcriptional regulator
MIAKELNISWNTVQVRLYKLMAEGLIKGKRVGRQNQWMVTEKGKMVKKG